MPASHRPPAASALSAGAAAWFMAATLGQMAFVAFILVFFGSALVDGDPGRLNDKPHITGYAPGDVLGNAQFIGHALLGGLITFAGAWQLVPALRRRWPAAHRWNGRLFLAVALIVTLSGFYLTWVRGSRLGPGSTLSITCNGLLILCFAILAWRSALRRDIAAHRRHALRAYLLVNGVWFLRIGMMLAGVLLTPLGITLDYSGATFITISFASWVLPLAVLELYLRAGRSRHAGLHYAAAGVLGVCTVGTLGGSLAALAFMWWPLMQ